LENLATDLHTLGFAQMSGIAVTNEVIPYREGGMNTHPHKMVGQSDFAPVSLARGMFADQDQLFRWQQFLHVWQGGLLANGSHGNASRNATTRPTNPLEADDAGFAGSDYRCDITVSVFDHPVTANSTYKYDVDPSINSVVQLPVRLAIKLYNCWPGSYSVSDLNAGDNGLLIQQLQLHHEGFVILWEGDPGYPQDNVTSEE
jgi:phage tail-like protein